MSTPLNNYAFAGKVIVDQRRYESILPLWKVRATWLILPQKGPEIPMTPQDLPIESDGSFTYTIDKAHIGIPTACGIRLELLDAKGSPYPAELTIQGKAFPDGKAPMIAFDGQVMELRAKVPVIKIVAPENPETPNPNMSIPEIKGASTEVQPSKESPVIAPVVVTAVKPRTLKGRAIDRAGDPIKNTSFIIYGGRSTEGHKDLVFKPIASGKTDATGNFALTVTNDTYPSAMATLGIKPDTQLEIVLQNGFLPDFTLLVLDELQAAIVHDHEDCGCEDKPGRLPEMDDLLSPESNYQQDIGGSCVNFTTPNRALEEFSFMTVVRNTDPEIMNAPGYLDNLNQRIRALQKAIEEAKKIKPSSTNATLAALKDMKAHLGLYQQSTEFIFKLSQIAKDSKLTGEDFRLGEQIDAIKVSARFGTFNATQSIDRIIAQVTETIELNSKYGPSIQAVSPASTGDGHQLIDIDWMTAELSRLQRERDLIHVNTNETLQRKTVSMTNQIQWDSPLPLVQPASIAHGHLLNFRQVWRADGYSMGDLLYSLPLAPGQKKQIVVHDWERRETAGRTESTTYEESLTNTLSQDRDLNEIVSATLQEQTEGHSKVKSKGSSFGAGFAANAAADVPVEPNVNVSAKVGYSGGFSMSKGQSESSAEQKSSRDVSANTMQNIREKTTQNAAALRSQRTSVVTSMSQNESTTVRSESVANYNHCHAITIEYFEILRHLAVHTELVDVQECLFIPLTMSFFDDAKVVRWADLLRYALRAPRSKYARLVRGFEALRRYYDVNALGKSQDDVYYNVPEGRYCDEFVNEVSGTFRLKVHFACPVKSSKVLDENGTKPIVALAGAATAGGGGAGFGLFNQEHIQEMLRELMIDERTDQVRWRAQLGFVKEMEDIRHKVNRVADNRREEVFQAEMAKVNAVGQYARYIKLSMTTNTSHDLNSAHMNLVRSGDVKRARVNGEVPVYDFAFRASGSEVAVQRDEIMRFGIKASWNALPEGSVITLERLTATYESRYINGQLVNTAPNDDLLASPSLINTPMTDNERVSPRQEDLQLRSELLDHLNCNMEYYHKAIWVQMDADRRMMLLEGFNIDMPVDNPAYVSGGNLPEFLAPVKKSVASVVENRLIGIVGNSLIMPVAKGFNLNPVFRYASDMMEVDGKQVSRLMAHYMPEKGFKDTPFRISLPTKGVFAEAVMGACNSCEKIDNSRFWKWEEHPIPDSPTAIDPVSTDSRRAEPTNLTPTEMAQTLLQLQQGKDLPDPTGLGKALELLGKGDLFKDITGLEGNQKNAIEALKTNAEAAKHYADLAADLAKSAEVAKNGDDFADSVKKNISDPKKQQEILEQYYKDKAGGHAEKGGDAKGDSPSGLEQAAMDAVRSAAESAKGKSKVTLPDGTSVETEHEGGAPGENKPGEEAFGTVTADLGAGTEFPMQDYLPFAFRDVVPDNPIPGAL